MLIKVVNFYNSQFETFLKDNNIGMYLTYNNRKSFVAERFINMLKNKIYKEMKTVSKNETYFKSNFYAEYNIDYVMTKMIM